MQITVEVSRNGQGILETLNTLILTTSFSWPLKSAISAAGLVQVIRRVFWYLRSVDTLQQWWKA
jgi:hypothetical protein